MEHALFEPLLLSSSPTCNVPNWLVDPYPYRCVLHALISVLPYPTYVLASCVQTTASKESQDQQHSLDALHYGSNHRIPSLIGRIRATANLDGIENRSPAVAEVLLPLQLAPFHPSSYRASCGKISDCAYCILISAQKASHPAFRAS